MEQLLYDPAALTDPARAWLACASPAAVSQTLALGLQLRSALPESTEVFPAASPAGTAASPAGTAARDGVGSSIRGRLAEADVAALLAARWPVRDTAKSAHAADFIIDTDGGPVLIEVKDYSDAVPRREIAKLHSDATARGAAAAVLLSLASPVATVADSFAVRFESSPRVPIIYAAPLRGRGPDGRRHRLSPDTIQLAVEVAVGLARAAAALRVDARARDDVIARLVDVRGLLDELTGARADLRLAAAATTTALASCAERLAGTETRLRATVGDLLAELDHESARVTAGELGTELARRYPAAAAPEFAAALATLAPPLFRSAPPDALDRLDEWRFLKTRAVHTGGWGFNFARGASIVIPHEVATACGIASNTVLRLLLDHAAQAKFSGGVLEIALTPDTVSALAALLKGEHALP